MSNLSCQIKWSFSGQGISLWTLNLVFVQKVRRISDETELRANSILLPLPVITLATIVFFLLKMKDVKSVLAGMWKESDNKEWNRIAFFL